jgi:hypothetical protein
MGKQIKNNNMKHVKTFESFLCESIAEGFMSELDIIRQESHDVKDFIKAAIAEYPSLRGGETWLTGLWKAAESVDESSLNEWRKPAVEDLIHDMKVKITKGRYAGSTGIIHDFQLTDGGDLVDDQIDILVDKPGKPKSYIGLDDILIESINEAKQAKFEVGKKYKHDRFGEFEVIELMSGQNTKVQFKKEPKGETSIIAGWGSDGYQEIKESVNESISSDASKAASWINNEYEKDGFDREAFGYALKDYFKKVYPSEDLQSEILDILSSKHRFNFEPNKSALIISPRMY